MMVQGFSHVTIAVSNLGRSLEFYSRTLGMKVVHQGRSDAYLEWGNAWICLIERPERWVQGQCLGVDHIAFYIDPSHFSDAVQVLKEANVEIVRGPITRGIGLSINFLDPDGTQLELHTSTLEERMRVWK
ncbi:MAG: VOC family protein [Alicyclobacillus sp.]|nr:VOC family protein [Alicyclobacillus sp.]